MQADFMPSAGFMFVLSIVQSPGLALPDHPSDRVIVSAAGLMKFGILSH